MSVNSTCFHVKMVKDMLKTPVTDDEALSIMVLLHLCPIEVSAGTLSEAPDVRLVEPITPRHAGNALLASGGIQRWSGHNRRSGITSGTKTRCLRL